MQCHGAPGYRSVEPCRQDHGLGARAAASVSLRMLGDRTTISTEPARSWHVGQVSCRVVMQVASSSFIVEMVAVPV